MSQIEDKISLDSLASEGTVKVGRERELARDDSLDLARRLYHAMCVRYPHRFITLFDPHARMVARSDRPGHA
jgi:hypothetical protein